MSGGMKGILLAEIVCAEKPESAQWHQKDTISHFCKTIYAKNGSVLAIFPTKTPPAGNTPILTRHVTL